MPIFVTEDVLKLLTSKDVNDEQTLNILVIFVTEDVSKLLTSKDVSDEQL